MTIIRMQSTVFHLLEMYTVYNESLHAGILCWTLLEDMSLVTFLPRKRKSVWKSFGEFHHVLMEISTTWCWSWRTQRSAVWSEEPHLWEWEVECCSTPPIPRMQWHWNRVPIHICGRLQRSSLHKIPSHHAMGYSIKRCGLVSLDTKSRWWKHRRLVDICDLR